jgi:NTE family protein
MRIGGHPYIDGGAASNASADLLVDEPVDEVYVLAPMASIQFDRRRAITRGILADVAQLRASGKHVLLVSPGPEDLELIGANLMNPRRRTAVLEKAMETATVELRAQLVGLSKGQSARRSCQPPV